MQLKTRCFIDMVRSMLFAYEESWVHWISHCRYFFAIVVLRAICTCYWHSQSVYLPVFLVFYRLQMWSSLETFGVVVLLYGLSIAGVSNSNCTVGHMRTYKVTRGPHYDSDATVAVPELNFTSYFLRKVSWIIGKSFVAVSTLVLIKSNRPRNLCTR